MLSLPNVTQRDLDRLILAAREHPGDTSAFLAALAAPGEMLCALTLLGPTKDVHEVVEDYRPDKDHVVRGNLHVSGHLFNAGRLSIRGNLRVDGNYIEGDSYARLAVTDAYYNDYSLLVGGALTVSVLLDSDHEIVTSALSVKHRGFAGASELLTEGLFAEDGFDPAAFHKALSSGTATTRSAVAELDTVSARVANLLMMASKAKEWAFDSVGGQRALRLVMEDGGRQLSVISDEEAVAVEARLRPNRSDS